MLVKLELKNYRVLKEFFYLKYLKKNNNFLGIYRFKLLSRLSKKPIIALGGISINNLKKLNLINCLGFAGISFFK